MTQRLMYFVGVVAVLGGSAIVRRPADAQAPISLDVQAPELVGGPWLNTTKKQAITLASRKGKVTIVEFWTFG